MQGNRAYALMPRGRIPGGETVRKAAGRTHSGIIACGEYLDSDICCVTAHTIASSPGL